MNDHDHTTDGPPTEPTEQLPAADKAAAAPRKLKRSRGDRMLAGVAGGLGQYFDVDPVIFRIAFGVSVFFGGLGVLAYLAFALFLPDSEGEAPVSSSRWGLLGAILLIALVAIPAIGWGIGGSHWGDWGILWLLIPAAVAVGAYAVLRDRGEPTSAGSVLRAVLLAGAAVVAFFIVMTAGAIATGFGHGIVAAALVIAAGVVIAVSAFAGGWRWLIIPAVGLATGVGIAAAADLDLDGGIGEREYTPLTAAEIPAGGYDLALGELGVDLRRLDWKAERVVHVDLDLGLGEATVIVPSDVCVVADAHAGAGELLVAGERAEGVDVDNDQGAGSTSTPRLVLDANLQAGELRVLNDDDVQLGAHRGFDRDDDAQLSLREAQAAACGA